MGCTDFRSGELARGNQSGHEVLLGDGGIQVVLHRACFRGTKADRGHLVQPALRGGELSKNERAPRLGRQTRSKILQHRGKRRIAGIKLLQGQIKILGVVIRRFAQPVLQQPLIGILQELAPRIGIHLLARGREQILHRFDIRRNGDAVRPLDHKESAREIAPVDGAAGIFHQFRSQSALCLERRRVLWIGTQRLLHVVAGAVAVRFQQASIGDPLGRKRSERGGMVFFGFRFRSLRAYTALLLNLRLSRLDLFARFCELRAQEGDPAALDAGLAGGFDGGRGFVQALFKQGILRACQQALVNLRQPQAGFGICGIARLQLAVELQGIVARGFGQSIRGQRRGGTRQNARFNRGGLRAFAQGRRHGFLAAASMRYPCNGADDEQCCNGADDQPCGARRRCGLAHRSLRRAPPLTLILLDCRFGKQFCPRGGHRLVDETIDQSGADQRGERGFIIAMTRGDQHQIRELTFDLLDEEPGIFMQGLHIEDDNADFAGDQQVADLVGGWDVPQTPGPANRLAQGLQEGVVRGQNDDLDDFAREAELERVQRAAVLVRS